ncbi:MAG: hypothetical protein NTV32_01775, partial [Gammaproteobacteria bacterium]|nr:hypothetical protein [Gammaproteobacteria bacterium]
PIRCLLVAALGIGLSGMFMEVNAENSAVCQPVQVTVVNSSNQDVSLVGANGASLIKAKSTSEIAFQSKTFYTQCGLLEVGLNGQAFKRGLIDANSQKVDIHVTPTGQFEQIGMNQAGLDLDQYISWWGLRAVTG